MRIKIVRCNHHEKEFRLYREDGLTMLMLYFVDIYITTWD